MGDQDEDDRTKHILIVRSGKSEPEITNIRRLCSTYCTIEAITTDIHEASRGLSATTELLGSILFVCFIVKLPPDHTLRETESCVWPSWVKKWARDRRELQLSYLNRPSPFNTVKARSSSWYYLAFGCGHEHGQTCTRCRSRCPSGRCCGTAGRHSTPLSRSAECVDEYQDHIVNCTLSMAASHRPLYSRPLNAV